MVRRTPQWATKIFKYRKTIAILSVAVTVMAVMLLIPPSENAPQPASAPPVDLTGFVIVYMFGVLLFIVYIIKSKHLDYKSPILQLREDKNYARKLIEELKDFPCPYCGGPVEVDKLFLVGKDLVRLKCRSCDRISLFEYLNKRWVLIGPVTPYVEKPIEYYKRALEALEVSV